MTKDEKELVEGVKRVLQEHHCHLRVTTEKLHDRFGNASDVASVTIIGPGVLIPIENLALELSTV